MNIKYFHLNNLTSPSPEKIAGIFEMTEIDFTLSVIPAEAKLVIRGYSDMTEEFYVATCFYSRWHKKDEWEFFPTKTKFQGEMEISSYKKPDWSKSGYFDLE